MDEVHQKYDQLLKDYARLQEATKGRQWPKLDVVALTVKTDAIATIDQVQTAVAGYEVSLEGWVRRQSGIFVTPSTEMTAKAGVPLVGEWCIDEHHSLHLDQDGRGGWTLTTFAETEIESYTGGEPGVCLMERVQLVAEPGIAEGKLAYRVYWGGAWPEVRRICSRFAGFVGRAKKSVPGRATDARSEEPTT